MNKYQKRLEVSNYASALHRTSNYNAQQQLLIWGIVVMNSFYSFGIPRCRVMALITFIVSMTKSYK